MRYSLRNQQKIKEAYGDKNLKRIINSLDIAFEKGKFEYRKLQNEKYPIIDIDDSGHSCGLILFYVIKETFDVYMLAFKEFVN